MILLVLHFSDVEGGCFVHRWSLKQSFDLPGCGLGNVLYAYTGFSKGALVQILGAIRYDMLQLDQPGLCQPCFPSRSYLQCQWLA